MAQGAPAIRLESVPYRDAFAANHRSAIPHEIPAGLYRATPPSVPSEPIDTVAYRAQLITGESCPDSLAQIATEILLSESFQSDADLNELFAQGDTFARESPEFPIPTGALNVYDPELKPLLNSDFVEALEGMRSFVVSLLIAGYLLLRWLREKRKRSQEHRMDRYIHQVLDIEKRQLDCDESETQDDTRLLQQLLDEVTHLRQEALREFTAHEINEDRSIDCFIEMCHALSDKINAKLTRQRLQAGFASLTRSRERGSSDARQES